VDFTKGFRSNRDLSEGPLCVYSLNFASLRGKKIRMALGDICK